MPELNRDNEKLIRKCCNYPKISTVALLMSFVLCGIIIPLEMIDDLVFHNDEFQPTGLYTIIAMIVIYMVVFCYCTLKVKFTMHGKKWTALCDTCKSGRRAGTGRDKSPRPSGRWLRDASQARATTKPSAE